MHKHMDTQSMTLKSCKRESALSSNDANSNNI